MRGFWSVLCVAVVLVATNCQGADSEDCIRATCRISGPDGSVGTGVLYGYGNNNRFGEPTAYIATANHVADGDVEYTCHFERLDITVRGRVRWRARRVDGAVIVVPQRAFRVFPRAIPLLRPRVKIKVGQALFSVGCPNGEGLALWRGVSRGYDSDGALLCWPGPELGRSGSPVFAFYDEEESKPCVVGLIKQRDTERLRPSTMVRAVTADQLQQKIGYATKMGLVDTQCQGGQCVPPGFDKRYGMPYRQQEQKRNQYILDQVREKSQGTLPLPPEPERVDLSPLNDRMNRMELQTDNDRTRITELERRADVVKQTFLELSAKYEDQLPGINADAKAAIAASEAAAAAAKKAAELADAAKTTALTASTDAKAVDAVAKAAGEKADSAATVASDTKESVEEALDENNANGLIGRLKARIEEAKTAGAEGAASIAKAVVMDVIKTYGVPVGAALAIVLFLVYRDVRAKITTGDPLLVEKVADRVREKIGPARERIIERVGDVRDRVRSRLEPEESASQPQ